MWTQDKAIELCRILEDVAPRFGAHVALTGGCLYKDGARKDADIMFYRVRQKPTIDKAGLFGALETLGMEKPTGFGWVHKSKWRGLSVDMFFPEEDRIAEPAKGVSDYGRGR